MAVAESHRQDVENILSRRYDLGWDYWTTPDRRLLKGSPFSCYNSTQMLLALGVEPSEPLMQEVAQLFWDAQRDDGRFALYPSGGILPCHTAPAAWLLGNMGYGGDPRLQKTWDYFLTTQYTDGGWRCNKFSFGRGPETEYSNAWPTMAALAAFRHTPYCNGEPKLDRAVEFLLQHWVIRRPIGPCHYGIGTLFHQVSLPLGEYNILTYVYVLSFYNAAKNDPRFLEAFETLTAKLADGMVVVERVVPKLSKYAFCKKGEKSVLATGYYHEILKNLGR